MGWFLGVVAYVLLGLATARAVYLYLFDEDDALDLELLAVGFGWPVVWAFAIVTVPLYGAYKLVTLPTAAQRRQRREDERAEERRQVEAEARRLGLPLLEEDRNG
jgi:hypothetical protein